MHPALFSISYGGLWGQATLELPAFLRHAKELGYDTVMLAGKRPHLSPVDVRDEQAAHLRGLLDELGLRCAVVAAYTDFTPAAAAEVPYIEMQIGYVEALSQLAARLGAPVVRVFTAYEAAGQSPHGNWQRVVGVLREICDRAAGLGVTIAVQNHHDVGLHTAALLELLSDVDRRNCRLGFDAWSPALRGEDVYEAAKAAAPHTVITTNADYIRLPRYRYRPEVVNYSPELPDLVRAVPFGSGFIDYAAFFQGLRDGGFDGCATYEMCSPIRGGGALSQLDHYASQYLVWMREHGFAR